jgi:TPR repeat protein
MEHIMDRCHYRPLCHSIAWENQTLSILDYGEANTRANEFLEMARELLNSRSSKNIKTQHQINEYLLDATDLGSAEAPYIIALRILADETGNAFMRDEAIVFLKLAAERGQNDACYRMACCYEGNTLFPDILAAGKAYFAGLKKADRKLLANYYLNSISGIFTVK